MLPAPEAYNLLFVDSFLATLIYPFDYELIFTVMLSFGGYSVIRTFLWAMLGSLLASSINFLLGRSVYLARDHAYLSNKDEAKLQKACKIVRRYGMWVLLLLSWHGILGPIMTVLAGLFNMRWWVFFAAIFVSRAGYYSYNIFFS